MKKTSCTVLGLSALLLLLGVGNIYFHPSEVGEWGLWLALLLGGIVALLLLRRLRDASSVLSESDLLEGDRDAHERLRKHLPDCGEREGDA